MFQCSSFENATSLCSSVRVHATHAVVDDERVRDRVVDPVDTDGSRGAPRERIVVERDVTRVDRDGGVAVVGVAPVLESDAPDHRAARGWADRPTVVELRDFDRVTGRVGTEHELVGVRVDVERAGRQRRAGGHLGQRRAVDEHLLGEPGGRVLRVERRGRVARVAER
jgi:hypothetical protein